MLEAGVGRERWWCGLQPQGPMALQLYLVPAGPCWPGGRQDRRRLPSTDRHWEFGDDKVKRHFWESSCDFSEVGGGVERTQGHLQGFWSEKRGHDEGFSEV